MNRVMPRERVTTAISDLDPGGVEGNRRLTTITAIPLLILLLVEGLTVLLGVRQHISVHVFVGMLLVPPIALKLASVGYRFIRYYTGAPTYRAAGAPGWILRSLGPVVVLSTLTLFGSGIVLIALGRGTQYALPIHRLSFYVWGGAMSIHVLAHVRRLPGVAAVEWLRRRSRSGTVARLAALGVSLVLGVVLAMLTFHLAAPWAHHRFDRGFGYNR
jgi:hypothetical protein